VSVRFSAASDALDAVVRNYDPLPVTITRGSGVWVEDSAGKRYLDALAAYSALNLGHCHPYLVEVAERQLHTLTLTSRAFGNDQLEAFCAALAAMCAKQCVLPANSGAEAVEAAIKVARKWGYERRGIDPGAASIIVCDGNFHGRTTTIVSFSDDPVARNGFEPFTPGFRRVAYGRPELVEEAIDETTVAFLVEPIQGEAGVIVPPAGYLRKCREICDRHGVLLIADEIQSGLGRTGRLFACDWEDVIPDIYILGKALGGGILPLSAVVGNQDVLGVLSPGTHGSTFGGNPLACAIGSAVIELLGDGELIRRAAQLGDRLLAGLDRLDEPAIAGVRGRGLWAAVDLHAPRTGRQLCERLLATGVLAKDTRAHTVRLAPPLIIEETEIDWLLERIASAARG
jgi:ornithine--oxo-acid transaminase